MPTSNDRAAQLQLSPSCPLCTRRDLVERFAEVADDDRQYFWDGRFFCAACRVCFVGSDDEWNRMAPARQKRLKRLAGTAA